MMMMMMCYDGDGKYDNKCQWSKLILHFVQMYSISTDLKSASEAEKYYSRHMHASSNPFRWVWLIHEIHPVIHPRRSDHTRLPYQVIIPCYHTRLPYQVTLSDYHIRSSVPPLFHLSFRPPIPLSIHLSIQPINN